MTTLFLSTGLTLILFLSLLILARIAFMIEDENAIIEKELRMSGIYGEALQEKIRETNRFRHDVKGLLQAMDNAGRPDPMEETASGSQSELPLLSAILEYKQQRCLEKDITFRYSNDLSAFSIKTSGIDEIDLCLLVHNLLDNAYEAALEIEEGRERVIELKWERAGSSVRIVTTNNISSAEGFNFRTAKATPELHGIGMKIIDGITKKYSGKRSHEIDRDDHRITITVTLQFLS